MRPPVATAPPPPLYSGGANLGELLIIVVPLGYVCTTSLKLSSLKLEVLGVGALEDCSEYTSEDVKLDWRRVGLFPEVMSIML
jgi:hypothetical protein